MSTSHIYKWTALAAVVGAVGCQARSGNTVAEPAKATVATTETQQPDKAKTEATTMTVDVAGVARCQPTAAVAAEMNRIADAADANGDGEISKQEAYASADFLVGGFFFRADKNGDGKITQEEGKEARTELMNRYPALQVLLKDSGDANAQKALSHLADMLDADYGKPVTIAELRSSAHQLVDEVFRNADQNHDGQLSRGEARMAAWNGVHDLEHSVFAANDDNKDGKLSLAEFRGALDEPTKIAFRLSDTNHDGMLSETEAQNAMSRVVQQLGVPPPRKGAATTASTGTR